MHENILRVAVLRRHAFQACLQFLQHADRKAGEGAGAAISRIYSNIGFKGLWNGLPVRIGMIGTLTAFQWLIYDSFKVYLGVSFDSA